MFGFGPFALQLAPIAEEIIQGVEAQNGAQGATPAPASQAGGQVDIGTLIQEAVNDAVQAFTPPPPPPPPVAKPAPAPAPGPTADQLRALN